MSTASWIQPPCRYLPDRGGFSKPSSVRPRQLLSGVVSASSSSSSSSPSCSCGYSEILNFDFGNLASIHLVEAFLACVSVCCVDLGFGFFVHVYEGCLVRNWNWKVLICAVLQSFRGDGWISRSMM